MIHKSVLSQIAPFVENVRKNSKVTGIVLYGSAAYGKPNPPDLDLLIFTESDDFITPIEVYTIVAKNTVGKMKPAIKSINELNTNNYVTLTNRYLTHMYNVESVLYEKNGIDIRGKIDAMYEELEGNPKLDVAYKLSPALIIRHRLFELMKGNFKKVLNDDMTEVDRPAKTFYQNAMDALRIKIDKAKESRVVELFYEFVPCDSLTSKRLNLVGTGIDHINRELDELGDCPNGRIKALPEHITEEVINVYANYKEIIEEAMWEINKEYGEFF